MMGINRRLFLSFLATTPWLCQQALASSDSPVETLLASASKGADGRYFLNTLTADGQVSLEYPLSERAHQVINHPHQPWLIAIARRPGTSIDIVDYQTHQQVAHITTQPGYHLYGHAQISADGRHLLTTEHHPTQANGRIVIRELTPPFAIVESYSTQGIGPHEFRLSDDQQQLIIANGGIQTQGRTKVNLATMQPSLVYLSVSSGHLLEKAELPNIHHQCSIRHIDLSADGEVVIAMQYQGHLADDVPLVAHHRRGEAIRTLPLPEHIRSQLKQYCGSCCFDQSGRYAAVSAPRGNQVMFWDMREQQFLGTVRLKDACGLAATSVAGCFAISTGRGKTYRCSVRNGQLVTDVLSRSPFLWDNHLTRL